MRWPVEVRIGKRAPILCRTRAIAEILARKYRKVYPSERIEIVER